MELFHQFDDELYKKLLDHLYDGVYFVDPNRQILYWNDGAERITGYERAEVIGRYCYDGLLLHINEAGDLLCFNGCPLADTIIDGQVREAQVYLHHRDGHRVPVIVRAAPIRSADGEIVGAVETFSDNSRLLTALQQVKELNEVALTDSLTQLANRRHLEIKMQTFLAESYQHGLSFGMLFIDIDHFKQINDVFGHELGDQALQMVASTLRHNLRSSDVIGRWGGEEFLVLLSNIDLARLDHVAEHLRTLVERCCLSTDQGELKVTVSIGATLNLSDDTPHSLLARADHLLYASKEAGRNRVSVWKESQTIPVMSDPS